MSKKSRDKGNRTERNVVHALQEQGIAAEKVSRMYKPGADLSVPVLGIDRNIEVKSRATGFSRLYAWLEDRYALVVKADRQEPLVIIRLRDAAEVAKTAERGHRRPIDDSVDASTAAK
jgi:Holliday junction resolvase